MQWTLQDRGFLPNSDPWEKIPARDFAYLEQLSRDLPDLVDEGRVQEYVATHPILDRDFGLTELIECENDMQVERAFMIFSYLASAIIHSNDYRGQVRPVIPHYVARPLVRLAKAVGRPPILSYASYCLHNWRRIDKEGPIELGNIELLQNFTRKAKKDEDWFILVHVDIEAKAHGALAAIHQYRPWLGANLIQMDLESVHKSLAAMNTTLARMPEGCSPDVYYSQVRPYIFGFTNVIYEGCFDNQPRSYRGETGAQSSIIPTILHYLGVKHKDSMLTKHLEDMLDYMPSQHVRFIDQPSGTVRPSVESIARFSGKDRQQAVDLYNTCLDELIKFRKQHFDYAVNYIEKRVADPTGTGGTPYVKWLGQLIEETRDFYISK